MKCLLGLLLCVPAFAEAGFESLMPKKEISEHWTVEGGTPPDT